MVRLEESEVLQRKIRQDDLSKIGIPSWVLAQQAIRKGTREDALELVDYARGEVMRIHDTFAEMVEHSVTWMAGKFGEEKVEEIWRAMFTDNAFLSTMHKMDVAQKVQLNAELFRAHGSGATGLGDFTVTEEPDRYVMTFAPCGTGGRIRKSRPVGTTRKPYPWSWRKTGVPYYCTHCCVIWEIMAIETIGYPLRVHENVDKAGEPCIQLFYKEPGLIPERYFTRVGKKRS